MGNGLVGVHHESLAVEGDFGQEFFDAAFDHFGGDVGGFAGLDSLLGVDVALFFNGFGVHFGFGNALRFGGNDVHADFAGNVFAAFVFHQNAFGSQRAVDVGGEAVGGFDNFEAAHGHVFAQFGDNGFALVFHQSGQRFDVGGFLGNGGFGNRVGELDEAGVFGDEVGFAVHFHQRAGVAFDGVGQYAFGGGAACQFAGFGAGFDAQDFFCFFHVAVCFNQGFFAFHHAKAGGGAQVGNHFCCDFSHFCLQGY